MPSLLRRLVPAGLNQTVAVALAALSCFLLAVPLTTEKPGLPQQLKADEPAYYLMALSLVRDLDLRYEPADGERLLDEYPFAYTRNLILMTSDGWETVHYSKPIAYPLFVAPFALFWGANGMVLFNMALLVAMVWLGTLFLARRTSPGVAAAFACGMLLLSACSQYVFWLQPEIFNMFGIFGALYWGFENRRRTLWVTSISGVLLALAMFSKPMFVAIGLPLVAAFVVQRRWRQAAAWAGGLLGTLILLSGLSYGLTGQFVPYFGAEARAGLRLCEPGEWPPQIEAARRQAQDAEASAAGPAIYTSQTGNDYSWLLRIPRPSPWELLENARYFLIGRHAGLLPYHPFVALAVGLFLWRGRRDRQRWLLLLALAGIAAYFLLFIDKNWHGGGGFVGNRYYTSLAPAFMFLVPGRIPPLVLPAGYLAAGLFVGNVVLSPFGVEVPAPTLQAHTRNAPLRYLPLELSLRNVPGYARRTEGNARVIGRRDRMMWYDASWWVAAGGPTEFLVESPDRLDDLVVLVSSPRERNHLGLRLDGGPRVDVEIEDKEQWQSVVVASERPHRVRRRDGRRSYVHLLRIETSTGDLRKWTRRGPPPTCTAWASNPVTEETFYLGARVRILGTRDHVAADLYAARIGTVGLVPSTLAPGERISLPVGVRNDSDVTWREQGAVGVRLSSRWRRGLPGADASGAPGPRVGREGRRSPVPELAPEGFETVMLDVRAPNEPGDYTLEIDLVYQLVAWFSDRGVEPLRLGMTVAADNEPE